MGTLVAEREDVRIHSLFDFFKKRRAQKLAMHMDRAVRIWGVFQAMLNDAPGAAYIFARTLYNVRRQGFWNIWPRDLAEISAHRFVDPMRLSCGIANAAV